MAESKKWTGVDDSRPDGVPTECPWPDPEETRQPRIATSPPAD